MDPEAYLVRTFLDKFLTERGQTRFVLDCMGPAPFHADFSIRERDPQVKSDVKISMGYKAQYRYDEIIWYVDTAQISFDTAVEEVLEGVRTDADLFYEIVQRRIRLLRSWIEARSLAQEVIELEQETSLGRRIRNYPRKARRVKNAIMNVAEYQMLDIAERSTMTSMLKEHVWAEHGGIRKFCEQEFEGLEKFPAAELRDLYSSWKTGSGTWIT